MKKTTVLLSLCLSLVAARAFAGEHDFSLSPVIAENIERCVPVESDWRPLHIVVVKHKGADESVGVMKKKGVVEKIFVTNDVKRVVSDSVRNTLQKCGYKFSDGADALQLSIFIDDFFTKSANEGLVGKDATTMDMRLHLKVPGRYQDYEVRYGIEKSAKSAPFAKAKRFAKMLNATLIDVMNQIAMSQTFAATVKSVSHEIVPAVEEKDDTKYFEEPR